MEEVYTLLILFFGNNDLELKTKGNKTYPNWINTEGNAEIHITQEAYDLFMQTFNIRLSGRIDANNNHRSRKSTRPQAFWQISSHGTENKAYNFQTNNTKDRGIYLNLGGWLDRNSQAISVRCFKNQDTVNVKRKNDDGTILQENDIPLGDIPQYTGEIPTKPDDDFYSYEFS